MWASCQKDLPLKPFGYVCLVSCRCRYWRLLLIHVGLAVVHISSLLHTDLPACRPNLDRLRSRSRQASHVPSPDYAPAMRLR